MESTFNIDKAMSIILNDGHQDLSEHCSTLNSVALLYHSRHCKEVRMSPDMELHRNLMCSNCWGLANDIVSPQCGHLVCRSCFRIDGETHCLICLYIYSIFEQNIRPNILINNIVSAVLKTAESFFHRKNIANEKLRQKNYFEAISDYTSLLNEGFCRHLILSNRSYAYLMIDKLCLALADTEELLHCAWSWHKAHYRHAMVLKRQNNICGLIESLLNALIFKPGDNLLLSELKGALQKLLTTVYQSRIKERFASVRIKQKNKEELLVRLIWNANKAYLENMTPEDRPSSSSDNLNFQSNSIERKSSGGSCIFELNISKVTYQVEEVKKELQISDFDCPVCLRICMNPVSIICGHTFCKHCIQRSVDHVPTCPLCKTDIQIYLKMKHLPVCTQLQNILNMLWPIEVTKHIMHYEKELFKLTRNPDYSSFMICTVASPGMPCELHLFEPRYRLMLRRAIESKCMSFGMVLHDPYSPSGHCNIGVILKINNVEYLHGGRYLVSTCAEATRYKLLESSLVDGYVVAKIEPYMDEILDENIIKCFDHLSLSVYTSAKKWIQRQSEYKKFRIIEHFGDLPNYHPYIITKDLIKEKSAEFSERSSFSFFKSQNDTQKKRKLSCPSTETINEPSHWIWWLCAVLPIDDKIKYTFLSSRNPLCRMEQMKNVINCLLSQNEVPMLC